jgi:preprotein translocase subunit SecE
MSEAARCVWAAAMLSEAAHRGSVSGHNHLAKFDPAQFVREVRQETAKVTWPTRKETLVTTGLVMALSTLAALFFLVVDQIIQFAMRWVFGL